MTGCSILIRLPLQASGDVGVFVVLHSSSAAVPLGSSLRVALPSSSSSPRVGRQRAGIIFASMAEAVQLAVSGEVRQRQDVCIRQAHKYTAVAWRI